MTKVRVGGFSISVDGFGAGPEQTLQDPLGKEEWNCINGCSGRECFGK